MIVVPFDPTVAADQELRITLAEQPVVLRLYWNTVSEFWFLNATGAENGKQLSSCKCVPPLPLFFTHRALAPIDGDFMLIRRDENAVEPIGYYDLGTRWALVYLTAAEVADWRVSNDLA